MGTTSTPRRAAAAGPSVRADSGMVPKRDSASSRPTVVP